MSRTAHDRHSDALYELKDMGYDVEFFSIEDEALIRLILSMAKRIRELEGAGNVPYECPCTIRY
jgi:hypothetical protein